MKVRVNACQSPEERKAKYRLARSLGCSSAMARRLRDWREEFIMEYIGYRDMAERFFKEREGKLQ